jgi:hypothetical protein
MISLADVIVDGRIAPQAPGETPIELYKRAAELGNQNGERGYKALVAKAQWDIVLGDRVLGRHHSPEHDNRTVDFCFLM